MIESSKPNSRQEENKAEATAEVKVTNLLHPHQQDLNNDSEEEEDEAAVEVELAAKAEEETKTAPTKVDTV